MKRYHFPIFLFLLLSALTSSAQNKLPVIRATSKSVSISDDGILNKNSWSLSPSARPDIYPADRSRQTKWVIFYTDIDSIKIKLKPGKSADFIILLNGKDSCFTRVASAIPPDIKNTTIKDDTISFALSAFNAIHIKAIINNTDTVNLHLDFSSFDFRLTKDAIIKKTGLLSAQPGVLTGTAKPDFNHLAKVFTLQMGTATWTNPDIYTTSFTALEMDGRIGWNIFEGKQVEINYDQHIIVVHSTLPDTKGYTRTQLQFTRSFPYLEGAIQINDKKYYGNFLLDMGADLDLIADSGWYTRQHFPSDLKLVKSSVIKDPRGVAYETRTVLLPMLVLNAFTLTDIPTLVLNGKNPTGFEINYLGNDLLKRFNMIFDFKKDRVYMKPNSLFNTPFKEHAQAG